LGKEKTNYEGSPPRATKKAGGSDRDWWGDTSGAIRTLWGKRSNGCSIKSNSQLERGKTGHKREKGKSSDLSHWARKKKRRLHTNHGGVKEGDGSSSRELRESGTRKPEKLQGRASSVHVMTTASRKDHRQGRRNLSGPV